MARPRGTISLFKLSVFAREEAEAIAAYLKYKLEIEELDEGKERIQAGWIFTGWTGPGLPPRERPVRSS